MKRLGKHEVGGGVGGSVAEAPAYPSARWDGDEVVYEPVAGVRFRIDAEGWRLEAAGEDASSQAVVAAVQQGACVAYRWHVQRRLVLHAHVVLADGQAYGIAGGSGWGKSTMGAELRRRGLGFLADDLLCVDLVDGRPVALAGPPHVRLWPDAAAHVGQELAGAPRVHVDHDKRVVARDPEIPAAPLAGLYVIARGAARAGVRPLARLDALQELVRHSYGWRLLQERPEPWHFEAVGRLVATVPVCTLDVPEGLDGLAAAADAAAQSIKVADSA